MTRNINNDYPESLKSDISAKRVKWKEVRKIRLKAKKELENKGLSVQEIRKNKEYCRLKREQMLLSKYIKHLEKKYNRKLTVAGKR
ncbi:MAG: hypothetical protein JW864_15565 [Spirochaetes bacterium]|nr:hypothetical protein [Spirochaetota bacterium]